jgi:16S rRNA (guanine527-N7)-methyltransferase
VTGAADRDLAELEAWAHRHGLTLDENQRRRISIYLEALLLWNRSFSLVSQTEPGPVLVKHFADSLAAAPACRDARDVVDIGSGAGFPGLVIAVALPELRVALVEARAKRCSFLADVVRRAGIGNASVLEARAETLAETAAHRGRYDVAISRALGPLDRFLSLAQAFLKESGRAVAMKGPTPDLSPDPAASTRLGYSRVDRLPYTLPDGSRRLLLSFSLPDSSRADSNRGR